jgi:hypothetical protein
MTKKQLIGCKENRLNHEADFWEIFLQYMTVNQPIMRAIAKEKKDKMRKARYERS